MRRYSRRWGERGDTIVEVMIAIAVVSSVLAGAFTVTQKSTLAVRDGQERGEMLQILQGQVELVRAVALTQTTGPSSIYSSSPKYFCIDSATRSKVGYPASVTSSPFPTTDTSSYPTQCKSISGRYNIAVTYNSTTNTFTFLGNWDRFAGGTNSMQLSYRIVP
ncbi:MAG: hypothetical protein JWP13_460 [Candidatus Saccharibacteria bacterium]|nr:hypothetical protein [Candidatus Saccharibacteria bacterium]